MARADDARIDAIATQRAIKAVRLWAVLTEANGRPILARTVRGLDDAGKDEAVRASGVKVASPDTWKVTEAVAGALEHVSADLRPRAAETSPRGLGMAHRVSKDVTVLHKAADLTEPVCGIPDCGCTGGPHP